MAGLGAEQVALPIAGVFVRREWEAIGCYAFENVEIERIVDLASRGRLDLSKTVTSLIKLEPKTSTAGWFLAPIIQSVPWPWPTWWGSTRFCSY